MKVGVPVRHAAATVALAAGLLLGAQVSAQTTQQLAAGAKAGDAYRIYVANEYNADITVIDTATDTVIGTIPISGRPGLVRPRGMALSPDGTIVYVSVSDFHPEFEVNEDKIVAIDVRTNQVLQEFRAGGNPERVAISPDGKQVWASLEALAQGGGYDIATGQQFVQFRVGIEAEGVAVSPDGKWVYVTAEATHTTTVYDIANKRILKHLLVGNRPRSVAFSLDGTKAYVSAEIGGTISVIDVTRNHTVVATVNLGLDSRPVELVVDPAGKYLYVAGGGTSTIYVIDLETNKVAHLIKERMGRRPWGVTITLDGKKVYTANGLSDSVSVIDPACMCVVKNIAVGRGAHSVQVGIIPAGA
jgi:YVTN family beta-propeller protein